MINNSNMSNPISAIKPNFGILTLKHNASDIAAMKGGGISPVAQDSIDRGEFRGDAGKELSMKELAKEFE